MTYTASPAHGRDYKTAAEVQAAWDEYKCFLAPGFQRGFIDRLMAHNHIRGQTVNIRYNKLKKVLSIQVQ